MRSGALRQRLQLQTPPTSGDGMGGQSGAWTTIATVWAQIDPISGSERLQAGQMTPALTHEVIMRYRGSVVPKMRLLRAVGGQIYEINAVQNMDMRNHQLTLLCSEVQTAGA